MRHSFVWAVLLIGLAQLAGAQKEAVLNRRIDLVLEKKEKSGPVTMDPAHVFAEGDLIRFRLKSGINGFLYVMNRGSSGKYQQLFPRSGEAQDRSVKVGREYVIPDSDTGWFRIQPPAGYETVYFLISPIDLGTSLTNGAPDTTSTSEQEEAAKAFATATPRCDDQLFKTRGDCLDTNAGLKPMQPGEKLPEKLPQVPTMSSRDLVVVDNADDTSISSTQPFDAPVIYHFRIAHK